MKVVQTSILALNNASSAYVGGFTTKFAIEIDFEIKRMFL